MFEYILELIKINYIKNNWNYEVGKFWTFAINYICTRVLLNLNICNIIMKFWKFKNLRSTTGVESNMAQFSKFQMLVALKLSLNGCQEISKFGYFNNL